MATRISASEKANVVERSGEFLDWLGGWYANLRPLSLKAVTSEPTRTAMISVDIVNGFCYEGSLSSPRVAAIVPPIVSLFRKAHAHGLRHFILVQDTHSERTEEFQAFPRHCVRGTSESQAVPELAALPFAHEFVTVEKNSIHGLTGTALEDWITSHPEVDTFVVVGDCTDLCVHDMAMDLRLRANAADIHRRVIVPANAVDTYDLPVRTAQEIGALPHDGNLLHILFLYEMALNGIEVVREIQ